MFRTSERLGRSAARRTWYTVVIILCACLVATSCRNNDTDSGGSNSPTTPLVAASSSSAPATDTPSGSADAAIQSYLKKPWVRDSSLLPPQVPALTVTPATANSVAARLVTSAHDPSEAGLVALMQLVHAAGMPVFDSSAGRALVQPGPESEPSPSGIDAGVLLVVHHLLADGTTMSLGDFVDQLEDVDPATASLTAAGAITAIGQDLRRAQSSQEVTMEMWADAIVDSNPQGSQLLSPAAAATVPLDGLQSTFLLLALIQTAQLDMPGTPAPSTSGHGLRYPTAVLDGEGPCDLGGEVANELGDSASTGLGIGREKAVESLTEYLEHSGAIGEAAKGATEKLTEILSLAVTVGELFWSKTMLHASIQPSASPLVRTRDRTAGKEVTLTANFEFDPRDASHMGNCLAWVLNVFVADVTVPEGGQMDGVGVAWKLIAGGAEGTDPGFVDFCMHCTGGSDPTRSYTKGGVATEVLQGRPQLHLVSNTPVRRTAIVKAEVNPNDLENHVASLIKTVTAATATAISAMTVPPLAIAQIARRFAYDAGLLNVAANVPVTDWLDAYDIAFTLSVKPPKAYGSPYFTMTGEWTVSAKVRVAYDHQTDSFVGTGTLTYTTADANTAIDEPLNTNICDRNCKYPPGSEECGVGQFGGCEIKGCQYHSTQPTLAATAGHLDVTLDVDYDAYGNIKSVHDMKAVLRGISETVGGTESISGPCRFGSPPSDKPARAHNVLDALRDALSTQPPSGMSMVGSSMSEGAPVGMQQIGFTAASSPADQMSAGATIATASARSAGLDLYFGPLTESVTVAEPSGQ